MRQQQDLNKIQDRASGQAVAQFGRLWPALAPMSPGDARDTLLDVTPGLVDQWGSIAGTATAEWYEETREAALGDRGDARLAEVDTEALEGSVRWAARDLFVPGQEHKARKNLTNIIDRNVRGMSRETMSKSIDADRANVRWARMMSGRETCPWCRMLASRGFVYKSKEKAGANGHAWGHNRCECQVVPDFSLTEAEHEQYDLEVDALYNQYTWSSNRVIDKKGGGVTPDSIVSTWRQNIVDYEAVRTQLAVTRAGSNSDGTIEVPAWDYARADLATRLEADYPDGFAYGRQLPPRNPSQVPKNWGAGVDDMPTLDANTWNTVLYGTDGSGGYLSGYGWVNNPGQDPLELPPSWDSNRLAVELQATVTGGNRDDTDGAGGMFRRSVEGFSFAVDVGVSDTGARFIRDVIIS